MSGVLSRCKKLFGGKKEVSKLSCPKCHCMLPDHDKNCPDYPQEWKECKHVIDIKKEPSGCCLKCGCPIC